MKFFKKISSHRPLNFSVWDTIDWWFPTIWSSIKQLATSLSGNLYCAPSQSSAGVAQLKREHP